jgi:hypothetical protein
MLAPKALASDRGSAPMDKARPKVKKASMAKDDPERAARLAEALRANLRRRKAQAREQTGVTEVAPDAPSPRHSRESGNP